MASEIYQAAKRYQEEGYQSIPILPRSKSPGVKWKEYQLRNPTNEEYQAWFSNTDYGIAILTGLCSRLVVVDIDASHGGWATAQELGLLPEHATVLTGSGGGHYYYRGSYPGLRNSAGKWQGVDVRAEGGYVLAPPTHHPRTGKPYVWHSEPQSKLPDWLTETTLVSPRKALNDDHGNTAGSLEGHHSLIPNCAVGGRNAAAARLAGRLVSKGIPFDRSLQVLALWNEGNNPPLAMDELHAVLLSITATHKRNYGNNSSKS